MSRLMDPKDKTGNFPFKWVNSSSTDIRETFKKVRERNAAPATDAISGKSAEAGGQASSSAAGAAPKTIAFRRKA